MQAQGVQTRGAQLQGRAGRGGAGRGRHGRFQEMGRGGAWEVPRQRSLRREARMQSGRCGCILIPDRIIFGRRTWNVLPPLVVTQCTLPPPDAATRAV
jgi:hypothetical protein